MNWNCAVRVVPMCRTSYLAVFLRSTAFHGSSANMRSSATVTTSIHSETGVSFAMKRVSSFLRANHFLLLSIMCPLWRRLKAIRVVDDSFLIVSASLLFVYGSFIVCSDCSRGIPYGSYWSSSIGCNEGSLLGTIKTNEYSWPSMCIIWLQVATLAHDFTSSQEVICRYALCTVASLVVPLFHSATLRGHVCESLMHPD